MLSTLSIVSCVLYVPLSLFIVILKMNRLSKRHLTTGNTMVTMSQVQESHQHGVKL